MEDSDTIRLTVSEYIDRLSKELNITDTKGLLGNEIELIALVRNCQFLYDKTLLDFKNIQKKNEAWAAIATVFGVSVGEVQHRWKGMRDVFNKCKNKVDNNEPQSKSMCPFYDDMKFLEPYIVGRRTRLSGVNATLSDQMNSDDELKEKEAPSFDDLKQFIEHIKSQPVLYHHKYSGGTYSKHKVESWLKIASYFQVPVKECLARWRNLRERYSRERRHLQNGDAMRKWELFDNLSFLDQHVKTRRRYSYTRMVPTNPSNEHNICYVVTSPSSSVTLDTSNFLNMSPSKKELPIDDVEFFDVSSDVTSSPTAIFSEDKNLSETSISENVQSENIQTKTVDEDDLFGQSIAAELKKLSCPRKKIKLKAEMFRLLYEHSCE